MSTAEIMQYPERVIRFVTRQGMANFPARILNPVATRFLNKTFADHLKNGELDFLEGKIWRIDITDAPRSVYIGLRHRQLTVGDRADQTDLTFKGPLASFITLALKEDDPDGLFFNRQLSITGETELGLEIKNFIDRLDLDQHLTFPIKPVLTGLNAAFNAPRATSQRTY